MGIDSIKVAISYAPFGVRDAAIWELQNLLGEALTPVLNAMDEVRALHGQSSKDLGLETAYSDAVAAFRAIVGEVPFEGLTPEDLAKTWLKRHASEGGGK